MGEDERQPVDALRDLLQSLGPVIDRVHAGHDRQEHLGGADITRRLVTADVLLTGLQGQTISLFPLGVFRHTDKTARQLALVLLSGGEKRGMRPTKA